MSNVKTQNQSLNPKTNIKIRAYGFSIAAIKFIGDLPKDSVFKVINNQLLRSATSIGANIVEAKSSSSKRDFIRFYEIALKSANETKYWLCLLRDGTIADKTTTTKMLVEAEEISKMLGASLLTLKNKRQI